MIHSHARRLEARPTTSASRRYRDAGAAYVDVARGKGGTAKMMRFMEGKKRGALPFAPPFVKIGDVVVAQTAAILAYLAPRRGAAKRAQR